MLVPGGLHHAGQQPALGIGVGGVIRDGGSGGELLEEEGYLPSETRRSARGSPAAIGVSGWTGAGKVTAWLSH